MKRLGTSRGGVRSRPTGYTLVEILVVTSIASIVLVMLAALAHNLRLRNETLTRDLVRANSVDRLDRQLRADARLAREAEVDPARTDVLRLTLPDRTRLEYLTEATRLVRVEYDGDQPARREIYRVPDARGDWRWNADTGLLVLELTRADVRGEPRVASPPLARVATFVGGDWEARP